MIELPYALVIEATAETDFFTFFAPELPGFTGVAQSVEDAIQQARLGMAEHLALLLETERPIPPPTNDPTILIRNAPNIKQAA
ncbi:type II toxin-antitoxin system HicB family antitoxin [Rhodoferax sp. 4810]|uniref:Type II toxin-antitoxin system HicB family antitoxin n=1 Tax=Thiospirillum jenense TaxID=1653858 RepID=A0A839H2F7_9GAMM|nr:type II toxin-antitoxin system HicB family antitoxin [Thiospirillum jenense]MBB1073144.1 type II toxin-antitoxin system HicB family antitoxin [Rhodoferax jenense]MBB1124695.1 type II toxin-antitoxin system HicB family antitoxin [Thiospirillum jenense]